MADLPILFSGPMVRALLAGTKTQTRRVLDPQPYSNGIRYDHALGDILCHNDYLPPATLLMDKGKGAKRYTISDVEDGPEAFGRYRVGDHLYVREAWKVQRVFDDWAPANSNRGGPVLRQKECALRYLADDPTDRWLGKYRQAMHMPRWASRITLTVTDVRVERLQDISEEDAKAEGGRFFAPANELSHGGWSHDEWYVSETAKASYRGLWDRINGEGAWAVNPWVAAYTFTVALGNIDQIERAA